MPLVLAKCPNCGGNIDVDNEKDAAICSHCKSPFVVEKAIHNFNTYYSNHYEGATINVLGNAYESADELYNICLQCCEKNEYDAMEDTYALFSKKYPNDYRVYYIALLRDSWSLTKKPKLAGKPVCIGQRIKDVPIIVVNSINLGNNVVLGANELVHKNTWNASICDRNYTEAPIPHGFCKIEDYLYALVMDITKLKKWGTPDVIGNICSSYEMYLSEISELAEQLNKERKHLIQKTIQSVFENDEYLPETPIGITFEELKKIVGARPNGYLSEETENSGDIARRKCILRKQRDGNLYFDLLMSGRYIAVKILGMDINGKLELKQKNDADVFVKKLYIQYKENKLQVKGIIEERGYPKRTETRCYKMVESAGGCYIATSVYGSYDCPEVWVLRRYRDFSLNASQCGRKFINLYYQTSPYIVKCFGKYKFFKALCKTLLDYKVNKLKKEGVQDTPYEDCF